MTRPEGYRLPRVQANPESGAFEDYLPGQLTHCLRLTLERLQKGIKAAEPLSNQDVAALAQAAYNLYQMRIHLDINA